MLPRRRQCCQWRSPRPARRSSLFASSSQIPSNCRFERRLVLMELVHRDQVSAIRARLDRHSVLELEKRSSSQTITFTCETQLFICELAVTGFECETLVRRLQVQICSCDVGLDAQLLSARAVLRIQRSGFCRFDISLTRESLEDRQRNTQLRAYRV